MVDLCHQPLTECGAEGRILEVKDQLPGYEDMTPYFRQQAVEVPVDPEVELPALLGDAEAPAYRQEGEAGPALEDFVPFPGDLVAEVTMPLADAVPKRVRVDEPGAEPGDGTTEHVVCQEFKDGDLLGFGHPCLAEESPHAVGVPLQP